MKKLNLVGAMILAGSLSAVCLQSRGAANDDFADAQVISAAIGTTTGDNSATTKEVGEPDHAGNPGGSSIWFNWTAPTNGQYVFNTEGSDIDTVLAVYTGASVNALTLVAENDDSVGLTSSVSIAATGGTTYHVAVDGYDGEAGDIVLNWLPQVPPINDDFVDAIEITGSGGYTNGETFLASKEPGEPNHAGNPGGSSVWFRWTAPSSGVYSFATDGSTFNTLLAVYTGASVNSLNLVASNDDSSVTTTSAVSFPATGGTTYYVAVDGFDGAVGTLYLNWGTYNDDFPETVALPFTTLHHFTDIGGANPHAGMILSGNTLYGTTRYGGVGSSGTVYKINTDGTGFVILHSFNYVNGTDPLAGVILSGGSLYGTTRAGGSSGYGTVFTVSTNGTGFTNLHQFSETSGPSFTNSDGAGPFGGVILSGNTLYGAATDGGNSGNGTVFALSTNGTGFTVLHSFTATSGIEATNSDGTAPVGSLVLSGGTLYGTANGGGNVGAGTVFRLNTNGTGFTTLHSFSWFDGAWPRTAILSGDTLYGTGSGGGNSGNGIVFALTTNGTSFRTVHRFAEVLGNTYTNSGGANPFGPPILSGNTLYGTAGGGGNSGSGAAFAVNIDGTEFTILHHFTATAGLASTNSDGDLLRGGLVLSGSTLYGTAEEGGSSGEGTVYKLLLPPPSLEINSSGANALLTWPTLSGGFTLQSTTNLNPAAWSSVAPAPTLVNGQNAVTNPVSGARRFFRLIR